MFDWLAQLENDIKAALLTKKNNLGNSLNNFNSQNRLDEQIQFSKRVYSFNIRRRDFYCYNVDH